MRSTVKVGSGIVKAAPRAARAILRPVTRAPFRARRRETAVVFLLALAATFPVFVETFRAMVFQTFPRDDYAPYLLRLVGRGGELPGTPHVLRFLSVAVAVT